MKIPAVDFVWPGYSGTSGVTSVKSESRTAGTAGMVGRAARIINALEEYFRKYEADRKSPAYAFPDSGEPKVDASSDSLPIRIGVFTGPQLKSPTIAPVVEVTAGTIPVKSISRTVTDGDSEDKRVMVVSFLVKV